MKNRRGGMATFCGWQRHLCVITAGRAPRGGASMRGVHQQHRAITDNGSSKLKAAQDEYRRRRAAKSRCGVFLRLRPISRQSICARDNHAAAAPLLAQRHRCNAQSWRALNARGDNASRVPCGGARTLRSRISRISTDMLPASCLASARDSDNGMVSGGAAK